MLGTVAVAGFARRGETELLELASEMFVYNDRGDSEIRIRWVITY